MIFVSLDETEDGINKITETLAQYEQAIDAVHIITHGNPDEVQLGNNNLDRH